jgi:hypothetical protein
MLYQETSRLNLTAYKIDIFQFRGGYNAAPVFCCLPFLFASLFRVLITPQVTPQVPVLHILPLKFVMCLMIVLPLFVGAASAYAANRVVLGSIIDMPLSASNDPAIINKIKFLRQQFNVQGTIRIIVGLRVAFAAEGTLDKAGAAQQREEIAGMQLVVLEKIPALNKKSESFKRYATMPFMALEVNAAEFEALINLTEITSIEGDGIAMPLPKVD